MTYGPKYRIQPSDRELAGQFWVDPFVDPSPDMMRLLNRLRWGSMSGKHVLVRSEIPGEWILARLGERRGDPVVLIGPTFRDLREAERHVFALRWKATTGEDLGFAR